MFVAKPFVSHSGLALGWKLDCDTLADADIAALARIIAGAVPFGQVVGIPRGGVRLADALWPYADPVARTVLIVDDVCTTGASLVEARGKLPTSAEVRGVVVFARGPMPAWCDAVLHVDPTFHRTMPKKSV